MIKSKTRQVKLYGKYQQRVKHWNGGRDFPWLNVSGAWLEEAGFKVGDQVEITVEDNLLIIKNACHHGDKRD